MFHVDISEVVVFMIVTKYCVLTYPTPSLSAYNTTGMMHIKIIILPVVLCGCETWTLN